MLNSSRRTLIRACIIAASVAVPASLAAAIGEPAVRVSQKERLFNPSDVAINRGETIRIVNDDYDLLHHAYVEDDRFSFDSGDQKPGAQTDITFPVAGDFKVLCGIHPKMKLFVHVK